MAQLRNCDLEDLLRRQAIMERAAELNADVLNLEPKGKAL